MTDQNETASSGSKIPDVSTKTLCSVGLVCSWVAGVVAFALGCTYWQKAVTTGGAIPLRKSTILREVLPLGINIVTAALTETMGVIHATTLRWQLDDRLIFNSNLRLLTRAGKHSTLGPWGLASNIVHAGLLAVSYCAGSFIFVGFPSCESPAAQSDGIRVSTGIRSDCEEWDTLQFCPSGLVALGTGLLGQALIVSCQLYAAKVPNWSTSPLETASTLVCMDRRIREPGRCMMAVHDKNNSPGPTLPRNRQDCAWRAHPEIKRILIYLWIMVFLVLAWFLAVLLAVVIRDRKCNNGRDNSCYGSYMGTSWSPLPDTLGATSMAQISIVNFGGNATGTSVFFGMAFSFAIMLGVQSAITIGFHCAELITTMSRDEDAWRKAYTNEGSRPQNALVTTFKSWKSVVLLCSKPVVHWLFGLAITFYLEWGIIIRPPQIMYLLVFLAAIVGMITYLCFEHPSGPQPATFGHLQTLVNLVDEWHSTLYWGGKGSTEDDLGHAGTAGHALDKIVMQKRYAGRQE